MKRIREIILDFTPLLDVTLIILFYFILFSHMGAAEAQQRAELAAAEADAAKSAAADMMAEAERLQQDAAAQLAILAETNADQAAVAEAMQAFARGENLKLRLISQTGVWTLRVQQGNDVLADLHSDALAQQLTDTVKAAGYLPEDVIFCEFAYAAAEPGSYQAYQTAEQALTAVRTEYPHLYISETDLST